MPKAGLGFEDLVGGHNVQLIDVGVEYPVDEANAGTLVRVLVWQFDVDLPETALERCCSLSGLGSMIENVAHTVFWSLESDVEFLPALCQSDGRIRSDDKEHEH